MTPAQRLQEISFDQYERYIPLERIGHFFRPSGSKYRVLEVGGDRAAFWPGFSPIAGILIPNAHVVVADIVSSSELDQYVQASGIHLPFRDGAFDFVCSLDTLERIPAEHRSAFLAELLRVTRDGLYLAFPFDSPTNRWAESVVAEYTNTRERLTFGLPDRDRVAQDLSQSPHAWIGFDQGSADAWLLMMLTYHSLQTAGTDFVLELNCRFNQTYASQEWSDPAHRAAYLLSKRRSVVDLEDIHGSLRSTSEPADLQSVLSFCQIFLTIAQNGRVTLDKDNHIRNVENALADARVYQQKWGDTAAMLSNLEVTLLDSPAPAAPRETPADWTQDRISQLLDAAVKLRTGAETQLDRRISQTAAQLEVQLDAIREQIHDLRIPRLAAQLETIGAHIGGLDSRLDRRLREVEIGLVTNKRAIQSIYDSRIWKAFSRLGGLFLRMTGHPPPPSHATSRAPREDALNTRDSSHRRDPDESLALICDYPIEADVLPVREVVEIRGWALAGSEIDRILVQINDDVPVSATYGIPRPDVARSHPDTPGSGQSGYRLFWDTADVPEGSCTVRVIAVARSGNREEIVRNVLIDAQTPLGYGAWIARHEPGPEAIRQMRLGAGNFVLLPRISVAVPVYKTPVALLTSCIESVKAQTYPDWELCLADDGSNDSSLATLLRKYQENDSRIRLAALEHNCGIAGATNAALHLSTGEYVAFLDHDDELAPFALSEVVQAINDHPEIELFYSDEDKIDEQGRRYDAFFKPDWSPDLLLSCNYICHFVVMKRSLLDRLGGLNESYSGSQDYEFLLRASEQTQKIKRIPKVLYHWRAVTGSAARGLHEKPAASADGQRALASHLARKAPGARVEEVGPCRYRVRYPIAGEPPVSILMPTGGNKSVFRALEEVLEKTAYKNYEIVLIDNSRTGRVEEYATRLVARKAPVRYFDWRGKPFNFSRMNNEAVRATASPYVLFLNDDTTIISAEWLSAMLEHAQRPEVGAVGALLWYPNDVIQHAGVVMGLYGNCSHAFKGIPAEISHYGDFPELVRDCSAVTGACLLVSRDKFFAAGAFDEVNLAIAFQDVDLCLKLLELGYRNVYTPYAKLYHFESATKSDEEKIPDPTEDAFMKSKWAKYIADDPYYNPNLTRRRENFSLSMD